MIQGSCDVNPSGRHITDNQGCIVCGQKFKPYSQGSFRLKRLAGRQQRVLNAMSRAGKPVTAADLAKECDLTANEVGRVLRNLRIDGLVRLIGEGHTGRNLNGMAKLYECAAVTVE